ncbi:unnamed protein product, partial [Porites lobata]
KSALEDFAGKYTIEGEPGITPLEFFENKKTIIKNFLRNHRNTKVKFILVCIMGKMEVGPQQRFEVEDRAFFHSETYINLVSTDVKVLLKKIIRNIADKIYVYQQNGSGWYFKEVNQLEIHTVEFDPLKGSSYIPLPDWIMRKKAIVSIMNKDDKCFLWCILRYLYPRERNDRRLADLKQYVHEIKIPKGFTFPVKTNDITKFENANPDIPGINVFSVNSRKKFYTLRLALRDPQNSIDLFLYEENGKCHYSLIKNFSRLLRSQITKRTDEPIHICKRCLNGFTKESLLQRHIFYCKNNGTAYVRMPAPDKTTLKFVNHHKQLPIPFVAYADFECFTKPMNTCSPNPENSYRYDYQKHEPSGFCIFIKGVVDKKIKPITYTKKEEDDDDRVRDHCHFTGQKTCMKHYNLDPAHYYTSPGLAWDACLKETKQELQLLDDYDMLMMFERGIRGGISHISKRYAEANNKYMKSFDTQKTSTYIQYLDANNLYGWAMSQNLPTHGFKWMRNLTKDKVYDILEKINHSMSNRGKIGYIFEVDLAYPEKLWETHNDYPLAPEKMNVNGVEKLISHFKPRKNYVVHYRNLRQYLEMGMRITAVNRGISFEQSPWMEPYIRKNTELRKEADNSFEKDFFKLMNNSVFGKTIENIRKRQNIKLVDNRKAALKLSKKPNFERATIFDKNLIAAHMKKTEIYFNKPVYVGQAILDLSKTLMFDFHYKYIQPKYGKKAELLFTDTDSLMYQIQTEDFYKDITADVESKFDTSDYPKDHPSGIPTGLNKKVIGMFKDEVAGKQITHFIGLRPKLYSFKIEEGKNVKKCKGIKKSVVAKGITFEHYFDCLFTGEKQMRSMKIIQSRYHDIYSKEVNKIALSCEDDKRKVLEDKIHTLALR